jgi:hypothetical protein
VVYVDEPTGIFRTADRPPFKAAIARVACRADLIADEFRGLLSSSGQGGGELLQLRPSNAEESPDLIRVGAVRPNPPQSPLPIELDDVLSAM